MAAKTGTYTLIASTTLNSTTSSVTFSSIPQTYTDLVIISTPIGSADAQVRIRFNNDTATNYSVTILSGNGTAAESARDSNVTSITTDYYFSVTTAGGINLINVNDYSNTTTYKTALTRSGNAAKASMANVGLWRSTAAINRIDLIATSSTFASGSIFRIYGIEAGNL